MIATTMLLYTTTTNAQAYDFDQYWTTDQIATGVVGLGIGSFVGTFVEQKTRSRILGAVSGAVIAGSIGFAKDKWDHKNTGPNYIPKWNDTASAALGGAIGGFAIQVPLDNLFRPRAWSKSGFNNRHNKRKFRKRRR